MSLSNLTPAQLRHAADLKEKIEALQHELSRLSGAPAAAVSAPVAGKRARRKISAAGIARIRAAQKLRWAKAKGGVKAAAPATKRKKHKMSAAGRARIAAAAKARWARFHAAKAGK